MKSQRQKLIVQIISDEVIDTQENLRDALERHGMKVTQATVSRDINELCLIKTVTSSGKYRYSLPILKKRELAEKSNTILGIISNGIISIDFAMNTVVVKCHTGMAQAVCAKLDNIGMENVVGTIAGDDTIFILMRTVKDAENLTKELSEVILNN